MISFASRFRHGNTIRMERALKREELEKYVPSIFSAEKHESRSDRYTYIPTITLVDKLREEGFLPYFATQARVNDESRREYTKHMLRLRRHDQITGKEVPEIILLNSHDGSSSYQMIPGMFRQVCTNGLVCWKNFAEIRVPHKGDIVGQDIEGAYEVLGIFDNIRNEMDSMKAITLTEGEQAAFAAAALEYRYPDGHQPVTATQVLNARRYYDNSPDLWTTFNRIQENMIQGGLRGRTQKGAVTRTRAIRGIDGDIKLNQALWRMAEEMKKLKS